MAENKKKRIVFIALVLLVIIGIVGGVFLKISSSRVYIDQSAITAPLINLLPENSGILEDVFVKEGDIVAANTSVARVGNEIIKTKTAGKIVSVDNNIGALISAASQPIIVMLDPSELRVVGHLDENKGLSDIKVGDFAVFTVDTFGSKEYQGIVDEISPTSRASDVVFSISDDRPTNKFDVKVRFDPEKYPELKNGMSARIWVYKG